MTAKGKHTRNIVSQTVLILGLVLFVVGAWAWVLDYRGVRVAATAVLALMFVGAGSPFQNW